MDILLVEDDDLVRDCLATALQEAGMHAVSTPSGEAALSLLKDGTAPDVIVTDLNLGNVMDGMEFARAARALCPQMPFIYISGRYGEVHGMKAGERFLAKPFSAGALLRAIAEVRK